MTDWDFFKQYWWMLTLIALATLALFAGKASAIEYNVGYEPPLPARSVTPSVSVSASFGYDASQPWQEWKSDFAPYGYYQGSRLLSPWRAATPEEIARFNQSQSTVQYASYQQPCITSPTCTGPNCVQPQRYQPAQFSPAYQPQQSYAPQYTSVPAVSGYSFGGSVCGPGGCSTCANGRCR